MQKETANHHYTSKRTAQKQLSTSTHRAHTQGKHKAYLTPDFIQVPFLRGVVLSRKEDIILHTVHEDWTKAWYMYIIDLSNCNIKKVPTQAAHTFSPLCMLLGSTEGGSHSRHIGLSLLAIFLFSEKRHTKDQCGIASPLQKGRQEYGQSCSAFMWGCLYIRIHTMDESHKLNMCAHARAL